MIRKSLAAAAALAPLLLAATQGRAETQITSSTTTPVATATAKGGAPDDVHVTTSGSVNPTSKGAAITINSSNTVTNEGAITFKDVDGAIGIEAFGGNTGVIVNSGSITLNESYVAADANKDGIAEGAFAKGTDRTGIEVAGPGVFTGSITDRGVITIQGNDSTGISIDTSMTGSLDMLVVDPTTHVAAAGAAINITGDKTIGIAVGATGGIGGDLRVGQVIARGAGAEAIDIAGPVGGGITIAGPVNASGYRSVTRPASTILNTLTADQIQQGGPAINISANVGKGILVAAVPTTVDATHPNLGTGAVSSFGSAPAVQIGSTSGTVEIGAGASTYGITIAGTVAADGVYDPSTSTALKSVIPATAVQIGVKGGGAVTIDGGIQLTQSTAAITSNAYEADATAIYLAAGATVPTVSNAGTIAALSTTKSASTVTTMLIDSGGSLTSIDNTGTLSAAVKGSAGSATVVNDQSGTLTTVTNTGVIAALVVQQDATIPVTGVATAFDLKASTKNISITQTQSAVKDAAAPSMTGSIYFGSGDDTLTVDAGAFSGGMSFGAGKDTLTVDGGATAAGQILDSDGQLTINVGKGTLSVTNTDTLGAIAATSVNVGSTGTLLVAADPVNDPTNTHNTHFFTSGASTFGDGATIGLTLQSILQTDEVAGVKYTILTTEGAGTLTHGSFGATLTGGPFLYAASASADSSNIFLTVRRKSAAELGFSVSEAAAYDAIFAALPHDAGIEKAFLAQTTQSGLITVYDQMLPDQGIGLFGTLDAAIQSIADLTGSTPDAGTHVAGTSLWLQEVNERVRRRSGDTPGSQSKLFGLVGGYEHSGAGGGTIGLSLAYLNAQDQDAAAAVGEHVVSSMLEAGAYYRRTFGGLSFSARGGVGYSFFDGDRLFVSPGVVRHSVSTWNGYFADAHAGMAYEAKFGRFYGRPEISADYLYLKENRRKDTGGGDGFDLTIAPRSSDRFSGEAIMVIGAQFGRDTWFRPELRGGYREIFSDDIGETVASFNLGSPFLVPGTKDRGGWVTAGFSLKGGTSISYVALEGDVDYRDGEQRYNIMLAGRSLF